MNVITHDKAYCLYPKLALELNMNAHVGMYPEPFDEELYVGLQYRIRDVLSLFLIGRGRWSSEHFLGKKVRTPLPSLRRPILVLMSFQEERWLGDSMTFVVDLQQPSTHGDSSAIEGAVDSQPYHHELCTWSMVEEGSDARTPAQVTVRSKYVNVFSPYLRASYTMSSSQQHPSWQQQSALSRLLARVHHGEAEFVPSISFFCTSTDL